MSENKYTNDDLKAMQAWDLNRKIQVTQTRIIEWYVKNQGKVYVSFSGGKDSTVLLHLVRSMYPEVPAVFIDTGLEYPEVRQFVKETENTIIIRPKKTFKQVLNEYGYPVISKEVAMFIEENRKNPLGYTQRKFDPNSEYVKKYGHTIVLQNGSF